MMCDGKLGASVFWVTLLITVGICAFAGFSVYRSCGAGLAVGMLLGLSAEVRKGLKGRGA